MPVLPALSKSRNLGVVCMSGWRDAVRRIRTVVWRFRQLLKVRRSTAADGVCVLLYRCGGTYLPTPGRAGHVARC